MSKTPELVEHWFRHEYGRMVSMLTLRVGMEHLHLVEDAVQSTLLAALDTWSTGKTPDKPSAWVYRVACNRVLSDLRQQTHRASLLEQYSNSLGHLSSIDMADVPLTDDLQDSLLRMLFVCCDDVVPEESRPVLALKTLCGFTVQEIATHLFITRETVYKRLTRARSRLAQQSDGFQTERSEQRARQLPSVHRILYLLFTEGHLSTHPDGSIRDELCLEALRLATLLAEHAIGNTPESAALVALMHLNAARSGARQAGDGGLLLLEQQDRSVWNQEHVQTGLAWLARSAEGDTFSRYHAEAGIAAEHCLAPSFEATRWPRIIECYELLEAMSPSPLHRLNRAIAVAEHESAAAGLRVLDGFQPPAWLEGSYLWAAVLSDLHRRAGDTSSATHYRDSALSLAPNRAIRSALLQRLNASNAPA